MEDSQRANLLEMILVDSFFEKGINLSNNAARDMQNKAKKLNVPLTELLEVSIPVIKKVADKHIESLEKLQTKATK